ncbi:hypothetical protein ACVDG5_014900 [Mesorhizobium sp. ORM6]
MRQAAQGGGGEPEDVLGAAVTADSLSRFRQLGFSYFFMGIAPSALDTAAEEPFRRAVSMVPVPTHDIA